jgi:hypothetical protein
MRENEMHIKDIASAVTHGGGRKHSPAQIQVDEAKNTGQNQSNTGAEIAADIKIDSSRLPESARSAPAHLARELLAIQEAVTDVEAPKNFGKLVAQIAKDEQASDLEESTGSQSNGLSPESTDGIDT